jgi:hypothetical protein
MKKELLVHKVKTTFKYIGNERAVDFMEEVGIQLITDDESQIYKPGVNSEIHKPTKETIVWEFIDELIKLLSDEKYVCDIAVEENIIKKEYSFKNKEEVLYYTVVYSLFWGPNLIANEFIVFDKIDSIAMNEVKKRIHREKYWNQLEKKELHTIPKIWIFSSQAAGYFFHECVGHLLEEEQFRISGYKIGDRLFDSNINLYENWKVQDAYDDMGNFISKDICLIRNGVIENILSLNGESGNVWTEEAYIEPMVRMNSMYLSNDEKIMDIFSDINEAIYIDEINCGEYNPFNGEVGLSITKGYWVNKGEKNSPVFPFSLLFNMHELKTCKLTLSNHYQEIMSLCGKNGAIKRIKYKVPEIRIDWSNNAKFNTNRYF